MRKGQGHVGSTPTTSTNFVSARRKQTRPPSLPGGGLFCPSPLSAVLTNEDEPFPAWKIAAAKPASRGRGPRQPLRATTRPANTVSARRRDNCRLRHARRRACYYYRKRELRRIYPNIAVSTRILLKTTRHFYAAAPPPISGGNLLRIFSFKFSGFSRPLRIASMSTCLISAFRIF